MSTTDPRPPVRPADTAWWAVPVSRWADGGPDGPTPVPGACRTRRRVLLSLARLVDARGYGSVSLREVVADAGVTKGALYFHFSSKQQLFEALVDEVTRSWDDVVDRIGTRHLDPLTRLLVETDAYVARWTHDPLVRGASRALFEAESLGPVGRDWVGDWEAATRARIDEAAAAGVLRPAVDTAQVTRVILALSTGHHAMAELLPGVPGLWRRMTETWDVVLPAIAVPEWVDAWSTSGWSGRVEPDPATFRRARTP